MLLVFFCYVYISHFPFILAFHVFFLKYSALGIMLGEWNLLTNNIFVFTFNTFPFCSSVTLDSLFLRVPTTILCVLHCLLFPAWMLQTNGTFLLCSFVLLRAIPLFFFFFLTFSRKNTTHCPLCLGLCVYNTK